jgi:hypothetical protein
MICVIHDLSINDHLLSDIEKRLVNFGQNITNILDHY